MNELVKELTVVEIPTPSKEGEVKFAQPTEVADGSIPVNTDNIR